MARGFWNRPLVKPRRPQTTSGSPGGDTPGAQPAIEANPTIQIQHLISNLCKCLRFMDCIIGHITMQGDESRR
jgi:hypothetical protein